MPGYIDTIGQLLIEDCINTALSYNPEFIAQGEIIKGFINPDMILIGDEDESLGDKLKEGHAKALAHGWVVTDDASLFGKLGWPVRILEACPSNIKVTTPFDLVVAEAVLNIRVEG